jgi:hypothetical protein
MPVRFWHPAVRNRTLPAWNLGRLAFVYLLGVQLFKEALPVGALNCQSDCFAGISKPNEEYELVAILVKLFLAKPSF